MMADWQPSEALLDRVTEAIAGESSGGDGVRGASAAVLAAIHNAAWEQAKAVARALLAKLEGGAA